MIFAVRVTAGQESIVCEMLEKKAKAQKIPIYSIVDIGDIKGYIFIEAPSQHEVLMLVQKVKNIKGIIKEPIKIEEIEKMLLNKKEEKIKIEIGDLVEITSGPFKGEIAKVMRIDETREELTVELVEVAVPIPITIKNKAIKLIKKE